MNVALSKVVTGLQSQLDFQLRLSLDDRFIKEINAVEASEFNIQGAVKKVEKRMILSFSYEGSLTFACDRCLTEVKLNFEHMAERILTFEISDEDVLVLTKQEVDICPILEEEILLNLPSQILCGDECKGLCPTCGKNLNKGICGCDHERIDPRLEALKNVFNN
jgi:uncharacterized protein